MRSARAAAILAAATCLWAGPAEPSDVVVQSDQRRTYDCAGGTATVEGGFNDVTFRNCVAVIVKGGENKIDAGLADTIEILGGDNRVTWTERADGTRPRINNAGTENVITSRRAAAAGNTPAASATTRPAPSRAASPRPSSEGRVTIGADGVKVQGPDGTVTVGGTGGVTIQQAPPAAGAGKIRIDGDNRKSDHDCRGGSASVNGDHNDVTLRNCDLVTVNGSDNTVSVRGAATITINGGDNKVRWQAAADGSRPKITDNGDGNTISGPR
jgi:hypothetical protein